ncbi:GGDEF domain-containing protein [Chitinibacter sp. ZOR0017]|uniref:tetratricopeptide repeat-containing diguanylate cyclase n=1 Tax=Chitinibacter sp. ZOR0017 TaxID=1339254 RepID=UPI000645A411|nr:GGDEF domain-containing protein [Chitinibacter sp. ZOR0017]
MHSHADVDNLNQRARDLAREHSAEALACAQHAANLSIPLDYTAGFTEALFLQGSISCIQGQLADGLPLMRHALYMANLHQLVALIPDCLQEIARACYTQGDYDNALEAWAQCLDAALAIENDAIYIKGQLGIGQLYFAHDEFYQALNHHLKARDHAYRSTDLVTKAAIEINIGVDQLELGQLENAKQTLKQALILAQEAHNLEYQAAAMGGLGQLALLEKDYPLAQSYLERAKGLNQQHQNHWGEAQNLYLLGRLALARTQLDAALEALKHSLTLANEIGAAHLIYKLELALADVHAERKEYALALQYHRQGYQHHYQLLRQASPQRLHMMEAKLEVEKTRLENLNLREQHAEERQARLQSDYLASQDPLTGLLNRRGLELKLGSGLQSNPEHQEPLALLMIDIDYFKGINDRWGHLVGDSVLRQVGALLKSGCRQDDLVCRWGGEEFLVLLPSRSGVPARDVAERLRLMVSQWPWGKIEHGMELTISVGVTQYQNDAQLSSMVQRADQNLYKAKQAGRNQVVY